MYEQGDLCSVIMKFDVDIVVISSAEDCGIEPKGTHTQCGCEALTPGRPEKSSRLSRRTYNPFMKPERYFPC